MIKKIALLFFSFLISPVIVFAQSPQCPAITKYLTIGSRDAQVVTLKKYLVAEKLLPAGLTTNYFGPSTETALKQWQKKKGIVSLGTSRTTGYGATGPKTRIALKDCKGAVAELSKLTKSQELITSPVQSKMSQLTKPASPFFEGGAISSCAAETQTRTTTCPSGQVGTIIETRTAYCPDKTWSTWVEKERTCSASLSQASSSNSCSFNGKIVEHSTVVTAYQLDMVTAPQECRSESRTCFDGVLTGSYPKNSCSVKTLSQSCLFDGVTIEHGQTISAYAKESSSSQSGCDAEKEVRTCTNGSLSGTYTRKTCTVQQPKYLLISNIHRNDYPRVWSGWGAHLGHMLRAADGVLWFVDDSGNDVNKNPAINYFKLNNGQWQHIATQELYGTVQQNMSSIADGQYIYSYGIDVANHRVEECYFLPSNPSYRACNLFPYDTGVASNYIGATISPSGTRMVWWTAYTPDVDGSGTWSYIYNDGTGWQGPVTSSVNGYNDFSYVYARLMSNGRFEMIGNAPKPTWQTTGYDALKASGQLGSSVTNWTVYGAPGNAVDTWIDLQGGVHTLALLSGSKMHYFYKSPSGVAANTAYTEVTNGARFVSTSDVLFLLLPNTGNQNELKYKSIPSAQINGIIPWQTIETKTIMLPQNLGMTTLYPESQMYQTTPTNTVNVGVNGYNTQDVSMQAKIFHVQIQ